MKIGILLICTNSYFILGLRFIKSFMKYYIGTHKIHFYVFTDTDPRPYAPNIKNITYMNLSHKNWADATNSKFNMALTLADKDCDYLFYFDADTAIDKPFDDWFMVGDLVGGEHFNNVDAVKPYDRNPQSKSYVPLDTPLPQMYYYGAFFGGRKDKVMEFCRILSENQLKDKKINYEPAVNDESYINQYFHYFPPSTVPSSNFKFLISDKGGIQNTRDPNVDISAYKQAVLNRPREFFLLQNGELTFPMSGGRRKRKRLTRRPRRIH
jgi:hypothetical protein